MNQGDTINPEQLFKNIMADPTYDYLNLDDLQPYLSGPPSLSPDSQSSMPRPHSPSSASPHSIFSVSDDFNTSLTSTELDQLFNHQSDVKPDLNGFYLPQPIPDINFAELANAYPNLFTQQWQAEVPPSTQPPHPHNAILKRPREDSEVPEERSVGKHNKTERRYRQKVQEAQSNLRDAVPALRVLYGTSTEEQKKTTDIKAADGTVDGLGEFNRPNASAKTTIFIGARLYIEHLQRKVASLQRQVDELSAFRAAVAGQDNLQQWQVEFQMREAIFKSTMPTIEDQYEDESEEEKPKKKPRVAKKGARTFAAFAATFTLAPFLQSSTPRTLTHTHQTATTFQVIRRLPLILAQHVTRLSGSCLPAVLVPSAHSLVEWTYCILLAVLITFVLRFLWRLLPKSNVELLSDVALAVSGGFKADDSVVAKAEQVVGKVRNISSTDRYRLCLRLDASAKNASQLALLALLQPTLPLLRSPVDVWAAAKAALSSDSPVSLRQLLALDLAEAKRAHAMLPPTSSPIIAMAEQITLVHLNDLFCRFFVQVVDSATGEAIPESVQTVLRNIKQRQLSKDLSLAQFDREIRGVIGNTPRGTAAHALGLVLIGLWGIVVGTAPSAQAALASALAGEEIKGVGASLRSVGALREMLYPDSGLVMPAMSALPSNVVAIDKLALVCIRFIQLVSITSDSSAPRAERLMQARQVQKGAEHIRLVLSQTTFAGLDEDISLYKFDQAREKLVTVLSVIGRRAAGRTCGEDDSGVEFDMKEL